MSPSLRLLLTRGAPSILLMLALCQCATHRRPEASAVPSAKTPESLSKRSAWSQVTDRLALAVPATRGGKQVNWRFTVREAPGLNARSWPDGRIEITSGMLQFARSGQELAAVAAHEMAHTWCGHGWRKAAAFWTTVLGGAALGTVLARQEDGDVSGAGAAGVASGAVITFSLSVLTALRRDQEYEADRVSLDLLRRAGYEPEDAVRFWQRYAAHRAGHGLGGPGWWKDHPADAERLRRLRLHAAGTLKPS